VTFIAGVVPLTAFELDGNDIQRRAVVNASRLPVDKTPVYLDSFLRLDVMGGRGYRAGSDLATHPARLPVDVRLDVMAYA
jgi:hypothetical protein